MPVLKGELVDVTASPSTATEVVVRADRGRVSGQRIVLGEPHRVPVDGGEFEVNIEYGPAHLVVVHGGRPQEHLRLLVMPEMTTVAEAARLGDESWEDWSPTQAQAIISQVTSLIEQVHSSAFDAGRSVAQAKMSADAANEHQQNAGRSASDARMSAFSAAASEKNASSSEVAAKKSADAAATSATSAITSADVAARVAESTSWDGDRLTVNGKTSPPLTGPRGDVSKTQLDTAIAAEKARTVGMVWMVESEDAAKAKEPSCQKGDFIQVAETGNIYQVV